MYQWLIGLKLRATSDEDSINKLRLLFNAIGNETIAAKLTNILKTACHQDSTKAQVNKAAISEFYSYGFHPVTVRNSKDLFVQGKYFHCVFEVAKAYNNEVKVKAQTTKDGQDLMMSVWSSDKGCLKINECDTETKRNIHDGIKFLSAGLMSAIRNPTAHETALDWPIEKQDCIDILHFISYLFRQLDKATKI